MYIANFPIYDWNRHIVLILFVNFPTYGQNWLIFLKNKINKKKLIKSKKYDDFGQVEKISVQLDEYYKNGENAKIRKIYDNFP